MKKKIKHIFKYAGIDIRTIKSTQPYDFTKQNIDPLSAFYQSEIKGFFLRVPLESCRYDDIMAFSCTDNYSPYIRTLLDYKYGYSTSYANSWLRVVHQQFQPISAASRMGLDNPSCSILGNISPWGSLQPWSQYSPLETVKIKQANFTKENWREGVKLTSNAGHNLFGPTSKEKGELEFKRLIKVYESIKRYGFKKTWNGSPSINVYMLLANSGDEPRFLCHTGNHRLAALAALKYRYIDLKVKANPCGGVIRRQDVNYWPAVRSGYLSPTEALEIFDRMYDGKPPISFTKAMLDFIY